MTTIREQILTALAAKLGAIEVKNGYATEMGDQVFRSFLPPVDFKYVPAIGFMPLTMEVTRHGHSQLNNWQIQVQGISKWAKPTTAPEQAEFILADICENILGVAYDIDYNSGGTYQPSVGDIITGASSGATGYLSGITLDSGTWAGGDAQGSFQFRRLSGDFESGENINIGANSNIATTTSLHSGDSAVVTTTNSLADAIRMISADVKAPEAEEISVGASVVFEIEFKTKVGNPYSQ